MQSTNLEWIKRWAFESQLEVADRPVLRLSYRYTLRERLVVQTENRKAADLVLLANRLVWSKAQGDDANLLHDTRYLFCVAESGIWNDVNETVASETYGTLLKGYGQPEDSTILLFEKYDLHAAVAFVLVTMIFGWDAYICPEAGQFIGHISHDGYIDITASDAKMFGHLRSRFSAWDIEMKPT